MITAALAELASIALINSRYNRQIRKNEEQFASVIKTANDAIICIDARGSVTTWNRKAQEMFGYTERESLGQNITMIMPERFHQTHAIGIGRHQAAGQSRLIGKTVEMPAAGKNGAEFPVELTKAPWEADGQRQYTAIIRDISDRKRMVEQIRKTQKLESLGILAGGIAHDFNNFLMGIMGSAGLAKMKITTESPVMKNLNQIEATAGKASELTNQMLAYSGKGRFTIQPVNISTLIKEMFTSWEPLFPTMRS